MGLIDKLTDTSAFGIEITYWAPTGKRHDGSLSFGAPMTIGGWWKEVNEKFVDQNGRELISNATVFTSIDVEVGGWLFKGVTATTEPGNVTASFEIRKFEKLPDKKQAKFLRKAYL